MKKRNACNMAVALATAVLSLPSLADSGVYVGGGIGTAKLDDSAGNSGGVNFSESDSSWKAFVGFHFDAIPVVKLAAEAGYRDLGKPSGSIGGVPVEYRAKGLDYAVLGGIGLGPVDIMARIGGMKYDLEKSIGGAKQDFDGNAPVYGIGAWFSLFGLGVRAEYEKVDIDELDDAQMISVSAFYKF